MARKDKLQLFSAFIWNMISVSDEGQSVYQAHNYWDSSTEQQPHRTVDK